MSLLLPGYAFTRGRTALAHRRFRGSPFTICGYRVDRMNDTPAGRKPCPKCEGFLS